MYVPQQMLMYRHEGPTVDGGLQKLTQSSIELDMMAIHILNRALLYQKSDSNCVNPGIAMLWEDEKVRRGLSSVTDLEPPMSQVREYVNLSKSDQYFRDLLKSNLSQKIEAETEDQLNTTADMEQLIVMDEPPQSTSQNSKSSQSESLFSDNDEEGPQDLDQTIVNEELVMSLTQNPLSATCKCVITISFSVLTYFIRFISA